MHFLRLHVGRIIDDESISGSALIATPTAKKSTREEASGAFFAMYREANVERAKCRGDDGKNTHGLSRMSS